MPKQKNSSIKVNIIDSERGWGTKVEDVREFKTRAAAEKFVKKFNQSNVDDWNKTHSVPYWYMRAEIVE